MINLPFDDSSTKRDLAIATTNLRAKIPTDLSEEDYNRVTSAIKAFTARLINSVETMTVPHYENTTEWMYVAAKFVDEIQPYVKRIIPPLRGELRALGMPFGLPLEELAEAVLVRALWLKHAARK